MDTNDGVRVRVNLVEGIVELEGSEVFVNQHIDWLKEITKDMRYEKAPLQSLEERGQTLIQVAKTDLPSAEIEQGKPEKSVRFFGVTQAQLENLVHIEGDSFKIIAGVKGKSASERQVNYALLCCVAVESMGSSNEVELGAIKKVCEEGACIDGNLIRNLKACKDKSGTRVFIVDGIENSPNKIVKLTSPGREYAKQYTSSLMAKAS